MTFPLINRIYTHKDYNKPLLVWCQDLFFTVYLKTIPNSSDEGALFITMNWWKFMFTAKYAHLLIDENNKLISD